MIRELFRRRPLRRLLAWLGRLDGATRWPLGAIGLLGLIVAVELVARRHAPANLLAASWGQTRRDAATIAPACEILCLGDSQVKHGLLARVIQERLGRRTFNLALQGSTGPPTYYVLKRALEAGARPSAILLDGELLQDDPLKWPHVLANGLTLGEGLELAWEGRDAGGLGAVLLARLLTTYRLRDEIRTQISARARGIRYDPTWILRSQLRNSRRNLGSLVLAPPEEPPHLDNPDLVAAIPWNLHPVNGAYLERLLGLAAARDIPVYWLLFPIHPGVRLGHARSGWDAAHQGYLRGLVARYPNLTVLDGTRAACPLELLSDLTHLNRLGAVAYSVEVAAALARIEGAGARPSDDPAARWIILPDFRAQPAPVVVEDDKQSYEALKQIVRAERRRRKALAAAPAPEDAARR